MKKFILWLCLSACMCVNSLYAASGFVWGTNKECLRSWGISPQTYWFCGPQSSQSCAGDPFDDGEKRRRFWSRGEYEKLSSLAKPFYEKEDKFSYGGHSYVCCNAYQGVGNDNGRWIEYTGAEYERYATKKLSGGGTCQMIVNPCYEQWPGNRYIIKDCTSSGEYSCLGNDIPRQVVNMDTHSITVICVYPCEQGKAYESYSSNTCVSCEENKRQGIDSYGTCVKCASNEFFQKNKNYGEGDSSRDCAGTECCVNKTETPIVSKEALKACYRCSQDSNLWRRCVSGQLTGNDFKKCGFQSGTQIPSEYQVDIGTN